tara:strand:+ start:175 stop:450 length:276 start_codon:yes stop_codon:yes gene_type:complete
MQSLVMVGLEQHFLSQDPLLRKVVAVVPVLMLPVNLVVKEAQVVVLMEHLKAQIHKHQVQQQTLLLVAVVVVEHKVVTHHLVVMVVPESFT